VQTCIWPSWYHCHSLSLASVKSRLVMPFWYRLTWVVPEKQPLHGFVLFVLACTLFYTCVFDRTCYETLWWQWSWTSANIHHKNTLTWIFFIRFCQCLWKCRNTLVTFDSLFNRGYTQYQYSTGSHDHRSHCLVYVSWYFFIIWSVSVAHRQAAVGAKLQATNRVPRPVDRGTATRYGG